MKKYIFIILNLLISFQVLSNTNSFNHHIPNELQDFSSDGCSSFPDGGIENRFKWQHCCVAHDVKYWAGGTSLERLVADKELRSCVSDAANSFLGYAMYRGVRIGGSPNLATTWRWGYGWKYLRGYRPLDSNEKIQIEEKTLNFGKSLMQVSITDPVINYFKLPSENNNYCIDEAIAAFKKKYGHDLRIDRVKYSTKRNDFRASSSSKRRRAYTTVSISSSLCKDEVKFKFGALAIKACKKAVYFEKAPIRIKSITPMGDCKEL